MGGWARLRAKGSVEARPALLCSACTALLCSALLYFARYPALPCCALLLAAGT